MVIDRKLIVGAVAAVAAFAVYLFWYMSPYEQCVRALTENASLREIADRDSTPAISRDFATDPYKDDAEIRAEQKRYAQIDCLDNSD